MIQTIQYTEGNIIEYSWGYDQTNIDYYMIVKRTGDYLTLLPMTSIKRDDLASMTGTCVAGEVDHTAKPIRRKLHTRDGEEIGIAIESYGWGKLWDGMPSHYSTYA